MNPTTGDRPSELTATQWKRLEQLLPSALALNPEARRRYLDSECADDPVLRRELESLVAAHEKTGPLDHPIPSLADHLTGRALAEPSGTVVTHYEIQERVGMGGMGVVYRARDLRLDRVVALKFLPLALTGDAQAKKRFMTEARAAAGLDHTNVCTVYEIGETAEGQLFIAMAFVDGESLRDVIQRGPIPVEQARELARQIAAGLECAHRRGIVHRDVKPANVMIGADGVVKIVDFGIAKLSGSTFTGAGATPGTAAYMSPEQARGEDTDQRTDVWALGVVLYEMLTGQRPFLGDTDVAVVHAILTTPLRPLESLRADIPAELERIVARTLEKSRDQRFHTAAELRDALGIAANRAARDADDSRVGPRLGAAPSVTRAQGSRATALRFANSRRAWIALAALVLIGGVSFYIWFSTSALPVADVLRVSISSPGTVTPQLSAAISPNGRYVAFVATSESTGAMLWVRALDQLEAKQIPGTERAAHPFWSPDGRSIGFLADNQVKRVDLAGGPVQSLADTVVRYGPAWGPDGTILFSRRFDELVAVPASGGPVTTVLKADPAKHQVAFTWPRFLPDGRHFIYFGVSDRPESRGIYVGSLDSKETKFLLRSDFRAWYAPPGYLVFPRDEALMAQPFDATRLELRGEPVVVADGVWFARPAAQASFSVSETGALAYVNTTIGDAELSWFDRAGRPLGTIGRVRREGLTPQISPDGRRVALGRGEFGRENIWIVGTFGDGAIRLTFSPTDGAGQPVWAADGHRVMYATKRQLVIKDVDRGTEEIVLDSAPGTLQDWSRDGRFAVFQKDASRAHIWAAKLDGDRAPFQFTQSPYNETQAQLSPDGRWIAYTSNESGRDEVYVQAFPVPSGQRQVSTNGGVMPRWRHNGKELFYLAANQFITAVPVLDSTSLELGRPAPLFRTRLIVEGSEALGLLTKYDVAPDGERFLLRYPPADPDPPITVVINWTRAMVR